MKKKYLNQAAKLNKTISYKQTNKSVSEKNIDDVNKVYSKKIQRRIDKMARRSEYYQNKKSHELIEFMKENNFNYLVMEDLNLTSSKTKVKKNSNGICTDQLTSSCDRILHLLNSRQQKMKIVRCHKNRFRTF